MGWALAFRNIIGLLLTAAMCVPIIARIRAEEEFLVRELAAVDPDRREKVLSRLEPKLQMELRQKLMLRYGPG